MEIPWYFRGLLGVLRKGRRKRIGGGGAPGQSTSTRVSKNRDSVKMGFCLPLYNKAMEWAQSREDRPLQAWLLFAGSRLDFRRQDFYRSRDRAKDALTLPE